MMHAQQQQGAAVQTRARDLELDDMQTLVEESWNIRTSESLEGDQEDVDQLWHNILGGERQQDSMGHAVSSRLYDVSSGVHETKSAVHENEWWESALSLEDNIYKYTQKQKKIQTADTSAVFAEGVAQFRAGELPEAVATLEALIRMGEEDPDIP